MTGVPKRLMRSFAVALLFVPAQRQPLPRSVNLVLEVGDGGASSSVTFERPGAIGVGRDGRIYVAENGDYTIKLLTPAGQLVRSFGRSGQGPGDFASIMRITVDDSVVRIPDGMLRRVSEFTLEGRPLRTQVWPKVTAAGPGTVIPLRDSVTLFASLASMSSLGPERSDPYVTVRVQRGARVDTLLRYRGDIAFWHEKGQTVFNMLSTPFGDAGAWATFGDSVVAVADGYSGSVRWFRVDGGGARLQRSANVGRASVPVSPRDVAMLDGRFRSKYTQPRYAAMDVEFAAYPPQWSVAMSAIFAEDGSLWVGSAGPEGLPRTWTVFAPNALIAHRVQVPDDFTLKAVRGDRLYGTAKTAADVPVVRVYALR
jgi:hypothetical protein